MLFHKKTKSRKPVFRSNQFFREVEVRVDPPDDESEKHVAADSEVIRREGLDKIIRTRFIPWVKGEQFADRDDGQIFDGLTLYDIVYYYGRIVEKYSPTGEEGFFGQFEFDFESGSDDTADMLESVAMQVYVFIGEIVKVDGFDI